MTSRSWLISRASGGRGSWFRRLSTLAAVGVGTGGPGRAVGADGGWFRQGKLRPACAAAFSGVADAPPAQLPGHTAKRQQLQRARAAAVLGTSCAPPANQLTDRQQRTRPIQVLEDDRDASSEKLDPLDEVVLIHRSGPCLTAPRTQLCNFYVWGDASAGSGAQVGAPRDPPARKWASVYETCCVEQQHAAARRSEDGGGGRVLSWGGASQPPRRLPTSPPTLPSLLGRSAPGPHVPQPSPPQHPALQIWCGSQILPPSIQAPLTLMGRGQTADKTRGHEIDSGG